MATSYPGALDNFTNPTATDSLDSVTVPHASQHANANDAIEAIEAALGTNPKGSFASVKARIEATEGDVTSLEGAVSSIQGDVTSLDGAVSGLIDDLGTPTGSALALKLSQISAEATDELVAGTDPGEVDDSVVAGYVKFNVDGTDYAFPVYGIVPPTP